MTEQKYQHFLARTHLKRFLPDEEEPGHRFKGRLCVYRKDGSEWFAKPVRKVATYAGGHSEEVEKLMAEIEHNAAPVLDRLDATHHNISTADVRALTPYMALTACRNPLFFQTWDGVIAAEKRRNPQWARQFAAERDVSRMRSYAVNEIVPVVADLLCRLGYWATVTLRGPGAYLLADSPVSIGFPGGFDPIRSDSMAFMPVSKRTLVLGVADPATVNTAMFAPPSVNTYQFALADREVYSDRRLDPKDVSRMVALAPVARQAAQEAGVQAYLRIPYEFGPDDNSA